MDVLSTGSGEEALKIVQNQSPDVVLLDIMMPGMDGLECLEKIKKANPKTSVIMITALNDQSRISKAKKLGAFNYILKPFSLSYLETELMNLIESING